MKTFIKAIVIANLLLGGVSLNAQNFEWARSFGGSGQDFGLSVDVDALGNVYTTGHYRETLDFDPGPEIFNLTNTGGSDIFVQKMDPDGNFLWAKRIAGPTGVHVRALTVESSGNVYLTGYFRQTIDFAPGPEVFNLTSTGAADIFVQKMDPDGNFIWAKGFGGNQDDFGISICLDTQGNVYTTGSFLGTGDFNPGPGVNNLSATGANFSDVFVQKLNSSGTFVWARRFGGNQSDYGSSISVDALGNVYTSGYFEGSGDFDPGSGYSTISVTTPTMPDCFIQKMNSSGSFLWANAIGANSCRIAASSNNVYLTGYFNQTIDFDPGPGIYNLTSVGGTDVVIQKLDALGNFVWAKQLVGTTSAYATDISIDSAENVYTVGDFSGAVDFDPGEGISTITSSLGLSVFVQKMNTSGGFMWAAAFGGTNNNTFSKDIAIDPNGNIFTTGNFDGATDFDPGPATHNQPYVLNGDIFIHKMSQVTEVIGFVFLDDNGNGLKDFEETPIPFQTVNHNDGNNASITNNEGFFQVFPAVGNQLFSIQLPSYYTNTTPPSQSVNVLPGITDTIYFGIHPLFETKDLVVSLHPFNSPRPGFTRNYQLRYHNVGTTTINDVTLRFLKTEEDNIVSATGTYTVSGDTLIWSLGTLEPFSYGSYTITNTLSAAATLGASTLTQAWISPSADDATPENNVVSLNEEIIGSYDPNDKNVSPEVSAPTENEPLEYTIRFQNTGNFQADFVIVKDTLDVQLDLTSFQMIAASHSYELEIIDRIATWTFNEINLPDSTSDEAGSHGFIKFKVQRIARLDVGDQIPNSVAIYFDYNEPVITNTCVYSIINCISTGTDIQTACNSYTWLDGNTYTSSNNTATYVLENALGCDSIVTLNLTITNVSNIGTTLNGTTITANNNNATYQWLDCDNNNAPIAGETSQTYTATEDGNYAVAITENGCTNTSACVAVTIIGIDELTNGIHASVYPNPSQGQVEIALGTTMQDVELVLTDVQGKVIFKRNYPSLFKTNIELPEAKGVYFLKINAQGSNETIRLVKE